MPRCLRRRALPSTVALLAAVAAVQAVSRPARSVGSQQSSRTIEGVHFPPDASLLFLTPEQQRVAYRNLQFLAPTNRVARGRVRSPLPEAPMDLEALKYTFKERSRSLEDFVVDTRVAGLLVISRGHIVYERYAHGHGPESAWTSFSVAKSVLSLLYGAALQDGSIRSLDDPVTRYVGELRGSAYDTVTLRHLLQMSSGVGWNEDETDPKSDLAQTSRIGRTGGLDAVLAYMKRLPRHAPAGSVFNYNTGETHIAGAVLREATRRTLAHYLSEKIWRPAGMEADAHWLLMRADDAEWAGCCLSATLRDYGRIGLLALGDGVTHAGLAVVPKNWIAASTTPAPTAPNYGYLWWLEGKAGFTASGIFGQYIHVAPEEQLVVAMHGLWTVPITSELVGHRRAFMSALIEAVRQGRRSSKREQVDASIAPTNSLPPLTSR